MSGPIITVVVFLATLATLAIAISLAERQDRKRARARQVEWDREAEYRRALNTVHYADQLWLRKHWDLSQGENDWPKGFEL